MIVYYINNDTLTIKSFKLTIIPGLIPIDVNKFKRKK